jgi:hypothetical protein
MQREFIRRIWKASPTWGSPRIVAKFAKLGIEVAKSTVEQYRPRRDRPASPSWRRFLDQQLRDLVSIDFFIAPTAAFRVLFVFIVLAHDRRRIVHFNVTERSLSTLGIFLSLVVHAGSTKVPNPLLFI